MQWISFKSRYRPKFALVVAFLGLGFGSAWAVCDVEARSYYDLARTDPVYRSSYEEFYKGRVQDPIDSLSIKISK